MFQDLVAWVTLGTYYIPHSEDAPLVQTPGAQQSFWLLPYNYFDEDPSLASRDNVRRDFGDNEIAWDYSGQDVTKTCAPPSIIVEGEERECHVKKSNNKSNSATVPSRLASGHFILLSLVTMIEFQ